MNPNVDLSLVIKHHSMDGGSLGILSGTVLGNIRECILMTQLALCMSSLRHVSRGLPLIVKSENDGSSGWE